MIWISICFVLISSIKIHAQDIITLKTGDELQVKVTKIGSTEIEYKRWSNLDGPTYSKPITEVFMIKYKNGQKDVFGTSNSKENDNSKEKEDSEKENISNINKNNLLSYPLEHSRSDLYLNGIKLSDSDARLIFSSNEYTVFEEARRKCTSGAGIVAVGWVCAGIAIAMAPLYYIDSNSEFQIPFFATALIADICLPVGYVVRSKGRAALSSLADSYNRRNSLRSSISFSPTILKVNNPITGTHYSAGIGVNVSF